jgi:hypothetical protein
MPEIPERCSSPEARQFDFWLGEWDLSWPAEQFGGKEGTLKTATNVITKLYGPCVIEENFSTRDGSFEGRSLSVFDTTNALWYQTWVDSSGSYIALSGKFDGERMVLTTQPNTYDGETRINRMVFRDITDNSLLWEWQVSTDDGDTWSDLWTITYQRRS